MSDCLCLDCKKDANSLSDSANTRAKNRRAELIELIEQNSGISFRDLMGLANLKKRGSQLSSPKIGKKRIYQGRKASTTDTVLSVKLLR